MEKPKVGLTTEYGVNIDRNVENGSTKLFNNEMQALTHAVQNRRYHYPVFCNGKTTGQYAVPN